MWLVYLHMCSRVHFVRLLITIMPLFINGSVQYISHSSIHSNFRTLHVCLAVISFITEQFKLQYYISRGWMAMDAVCKQTSTQIWTWYGHAIGLVMQMLKDVQPYTVTIYCLHCTDIAAHHWLNSVTFLHIPWCVPFALIHTEMGMSSLPFSAYSNGGKGSAAEETVHIHTHITYKGLLMQWLYLNSPPRV